MRGPGGPGGAEQWGHAYNSVTGAVAVGEQVRWRNVYKRQLRHGGAGCHVQLNTGLGAYGSRGTVGNVDSGRSPITRRARS